MAGPSSVSSQQQEVDSALEVDTPISSAPARTSISGIRLQLVTLGLLRATEAIAWTSIFPYVYFMIQSFDGVEEKDIPFYAGLHVAVFTFCEFLSGTLWAKLSDRIGRRTTLLIGALCGMATSLSFGLSRSIAMATAARAFGGLSNPNVGLVQTCAMELARHKEQQAGAMSFVIFVRTMGYLVGPVLGGFLADPAVLYPSLFPQDSVWTTYRFLLPNLAVASLQAASWIVAFLFLPETHPQLSNGRTPGLRVGEALTRFLRGKSRSRGGYQYAPLPDEHADVSTCALEAGATSVENAQELQDMFANEQRAESHEDLKPSDRRTALTPQVILQIVSLSLLAFHKMSSDAIIPAFLAAPPTSSGSQPTHPHDLFQSAGGFGYSNRKIGFILLSQAVVALATQPTLVPLFINKVGALRAYRIVLGIYPAMYIATPLLPKLSPGVALVFLVFDVWIKVLLSSVGYICSAVL